MQKIEFSKYHALGNDYIVIDPNHNQIPLDADTIRIICHRNFGIGSDGILYGPIMENGIPSLRIFNPDGSEAEKSGNGIRIFSKYLFDEGYEKNTFRLKTLGGIVEVSYLNNDATLIKVDMGSATFISEEIPVAGQRREVVNEKLNINGRDFNITCVSVGNPHCVVPVPDLSKDLAIKYGEAIEKNPMFPNRINVQFLSVIDRKNIRIEIWERGAGYTLASGSSSTAASFAARRLGLIDNNVTVHMPGGKIKIDFDDKGHAKMTGEVTTVYKGVYDLPDNLLIRKYIGLIDGEPNSEPKASISKNYNENIR